MQHNLRFIKESDIEALVEIGRKVHAESEYCNLTYSPDCVRSTCLKAVEGKDIAIMVVETGKEIIGIVAAQITRSTIFTTDPIAADLLIYVEPSFRGSSVLAKLVWAYIGWAKLKGAKEIFLRPVSGLNVGTVDNLYSRLGFRRVGGIYRMEVNNG